MSIVLVDLGDPSRTLNVNLRNWRSIVAELERSGALSPEALSRFEPFCGGLNREEARSVASAIEHGALPGLKDHGRLQLDGYQTDTPDTGEFFWDPASMHLNYSVSANVLKAFATFCADCEGFSQ